MKIASIFVLLIAITGCATNDGGFLDPKAYEYGGKYNSVCDDKCFAEQQRKRDFMAEQRQPKNYAEVKKHISDSYDDFKDYGKLRTYSIQIGEQVGDSWFLRGFYSKDKNKNLSTPQVYISFFQKDWCFFNSAINQQKITMPLVEIDRKAENRGVREDVAVSINIDDIVNSDEKDTTIRVYGKLCHRDIIIPSYVVDAFNDAYLEKLSSI